MPLQMLSVTPFSSSPSFLPPLHLLTSSSSPSSPPLSSPPLPPPLPPCSLPSTQDMTARDLLQHRVTYPNGDTGWRMAPLVQAAVDGRLVLLEGIHRADIGTIAVLQRCTVCMCVLFAVLCVATSFVYAYPPTQYVLLWCLCIDRLRDVCASLVVVMRCRQDTSSLLQQQNSETESPTTALNTTFNCIHMHSLGLTS